MAGEATHPDLINGSLVGILSELEQDKTFLKLAAGDIEASDDVDNSVLAGIPEGLRPALAAAIGQGVAGKPGKPVVLVVASGREAEETVGSLRSWYDGDPNDIAQLEAWETLPHERLSRARTPWPAAWPCSADSSIRAIPIRCSARFAFSSCRSARSSSQSSKDWAMSSRSCSPWGRTCPSTKPPNV